VTALEQLGAYVAQCAPPSDDVRELVELHLIDTVGAWIAGAQTDPGANLLELRAVMQRQEAAVVAAVSRDLSTRCALARLSEIDDIHLPSMTTPGGIVIPGALTLAATSMAEADAVISAILAGYEVMTRLGRALDGPTILYRGIWPTYVASPFGIAAIDARLNALNEKETANALALALTLAAPGVGHHNAAMTTRWLAIGNAARNGLVATPAAYGFTSDVGLFEGNFFPGIYGVTPNIAALTDGLGERSILPEVSFKPWCAARQTMAATQAFKEIIASGVAPQDITEIQASVLPPHRKMIDHGIVADDRASHLTSLPYCMAVAAVAPEMAFNADQPAPEMPAEVHSLMAKIKVEPDESLLADYPRSWPARVRVIAGATEHERLVMNVPGDPSCAFDRAAVRDKFLRFVTPVLGIERAERILARCGEAFTSGQFESLAKDIEDIGRMDPLASLEWMQE
jgi:2-methylcitrate dehydratase PrpD